MSRTKVPFVYTANNPFIVNEKRFAKEVAMSLKEGDHIYVSTERKTYRVTMDEKLGRTMIVLVSEGLLKTSSEYLQLREIFITDENVDKYLKSLEE